VAVIGTGATAIQCVPYVGAHAKELYVFQRTPSSVDRRGNKPTDPQWAKTLQPGWQRARRENFADIVVGRPFEVDLVNDGWTDIFRRFQADLRKAIASGSNVDMEELALRVEIADFQKMNEIRARADAIVRDHDAAEALKPWYRQFCKRPTFNDEYLPTFNRPNVHLIDVSDAKGVERITEKGVVANGVEYEVDCIIFATGFETGTSYTRRAGYEIVGRDGRTLTDAWAGGLRTLHGLMTEGFPNCFFLGFTQTAVTVNIPHALNEQAKHVRHILAEVRDRGASVVEPTPDGQQGWVDEMASKARLG
jgi:cyclohexanone monooxygenase